MLIKNLIFLLKIIRRHFCLPLFFFASGLAAPAQINFALPVAYSTGNLTWPDQVFSKDINGDAKPDLICFNSANFGISILTNSGTGSFTVAPVPAVDGGIKQIFPADINGRGKVDLICASYYDTGDLSLLTNNGTGIFQLSSKLHLPYPPDDILVADMNADGKSDLIRAGFFNVSVFTNNGLGTIPFDTPYATGTWGHSGPIALAADDVNADGKMDVITSLGYNNIVSILTNGASGALSLASVLTVGQSPYTFCAKDLNNDGRVDIATANSGDGTLSVFTNAGTGGFALASTPVTGPVYPYSVTAADLDGDGRPELICGNSLTNTFTVFTNSGGCVFQPARSFVVGTHSINSVTTADVNGDGKLDVIAADLNGNIIWVLINTTSFAAPNSTPGLNIKLQGKTVLVKWTSASPGWSLQQNPALSSPNWSPAGYWSREITDDGTNTSLAFPLPSGPLYFRLIHP